jgi:hypothetical protein
MFALDSRAEALDSNAEALDNAPDNWVSKDKALALKESIDADEVVVVEGT